MASQSKTAYSNIPFYRGGVPYKLDSETIVQDAARSAVIADKTLMYQDPSTRKWTPMTDVTPLVVGYMTTGALGTNLAGFKAVTDGEFAISVGGIAMDITGLDFSLITALDEIVDTINMVAAGRFFCLFDSDDTVIAFQAIHPGDTVSVLSDVGGTGTDISGTGFLNALTGVGVVTDPTGYELPMGIYRGDEIAAATIVAGDVTNQAIVVGGQGLIVDRAQIILENSLTTNSVVVSKQKIVEAVLREIGIFANTTADISA